MFCTRYFVAAGFLILVVCRLTTAFSSAEDAVSSQQISQVPLADPFILLHDGIYYAYGTGSPDGIAVYVSRDLNTWQLPESGRLALHKEDVWGNQHFWAPEVYFINGKFYMYYTAETRICAAVSTSPVGPFKQDIREPIVAGEKCIDNTLFRDDDGKYYMFFDRFNDGLNIWVAEMAGDLLHIRPETMQPCIHVSQEWEMIWPRVNEGSFVYKHKGVYYMTYSANSYKSPFYGIGVATAPSVFGPWVKYEGNPVLQNPGDLVGVGHHSFFTDQQGQLRIVFHAHNKPGQIHPRMMYISSVHFEEQVDGQDLMLIDESYLVPRISASQ